MFVDKELRVDVTLEKFVINFLSSVSFFNEFSLMNEMRYATGNRLIPQRKDIDCSIRGEVSWLRRVWMVDKSRIGWN